ncbi:MAG: metal-dependent hydrolase [Planctomycetaceae bacterium]|nr:metal-dependent hydrolase [Planctomycetaceae bacterium]
MAAFREHVTVSGMLGLGYGTTAYLAYGFTPIESTLAGFLTAFGGMLPDLDSKTSRPVRELFGILAAVTPLLILGEVVKALNLPTTREAGALTFIALYMLIRYGGSWLVGQVAVHRGMFHSIPAGFIAGQIAFLAHCDSPIPTKWLIALGIMVGFFSHLILDEAYSFQWTGTRIKLKKSFGTALKFVGKDHAANLVAYGILVTLSYAVFGNIVMDLQPAPAAPQSVELETIDLNQSADLPTDFSDTTIR